MIQNYLGENFKLNHIGIFAPNLLEIVNKEQILIDQGQGVYIHFQYLGNIKIELLQPIDEKSFISDAKNYNSKLLHICYEVDNLERELQNIRNLGFHLLRKPVEAVAFPGRKIAWVYSATFGLIELLG
jgi:methylmalonyl-CoA/ethylmalonyl-CoA epimerase